MRGRLPGAGRRDLGAARRARDAGGPGLRADRLRRARQRRRRRSTLDPVRTRSILQRRSTAAVRAWFEALRHRPGARPALRIPPDPAAGVFTGRICLPVRHRGVVHGYVWLLDDGHLTDLELGGRGRRPTRGSRRRWRPPPGSARCWPTRPGPGPNSAICCGSCWSRSPPGGRPTAAALRGAAGQPALHRGDGPLTAGRGAALGHLGHRRGAAARACRACSRRAHCRRAVRRPRPRADDADRPHHGSGTGRAGPPAVRGPRRRARPGRAGAAARGRRARPGPAVAEHLLRSPRAAPDRPRGRAARRPARRPVRRCGRAPPESAPARRGWTDLPGRLAGGAGRGPRGARRAPGWARSPSGTPSARTAC